MVRNIVVLSGNSHPHLTDSICNLLGIAPGDRILSKFSGGESRCEIRDSVRGKDVFIVQSGGGAVNDHVIELCISEFVTPFPPHKTGSSQGEGGVSAVADQRVYAYTQKMVVRITF
jgi:hypothetical protein